MIQEKEFETYFIDNITIKKFSKFSLSLPCKNGATCTSSLNQYSCACLPGFQGSDCSIQINVCLSSPCKSGGTCLASINQYICNCPLGYLGSDCSIVYDFCQ